MTEIADISFREPIKVLADIIAHEMELTPGQIMLKNQKWFVPDTGLYVALGYISSRAIGNSSRQVDSPEGMTELMEVNMNHLVQVDIMSPGEDPAARLRKEEVLLALASIYSEQKQTEHGIQIGRLPMDLLDASSLEEPGMLNRFTTTFRITATHRKQKATADYYDQFLGVKVVPSDSLADPHTVEVITNG